tara:strand:+ start:551 stop:1420 length:870 start_codon:yes stop_codon:yes gene_type:complete
MNNPDPNIDSMSNSSKAYALFYSFFLIPLMITIFGVLFFFLFKMLTYESQNPHDLLSNIKSGSLTKRWQSAYELSNLMSDPNKVPTDDLFNNQMQMMYEKSIHDDQRVRTYLALAMGQTQNKDFCSLLNEGVKDSFLDNKIAAIKSIGMLKCSDYISTINNLIISKEDNQIRLAAVISAGQVLDSSSIDYLKSALDDEEPNIRWDSALSLAKFNDKSGYSILRNLLTRDYYNNFPEVDVNEVDNAILTVLGVVSRIEDKDFDIELNILSKTEKNIKIREFAMKILSEYY